MEKGTFLCGCVVDLAMQSLISDLAIIFDVLNVLHF